MSLPATVSLTDGVTPEVFEAPKNTPNGAIYVSASPQGDLQGAPSLRVETTTTTKGVERSVIQLNRPIWDAEKDAYVYFNALTVQVTRHRSIPAADFKKDLKKILSLPAAVVDAVAIAQL